MSKYGYTNLCSIYSYTVNGQSYRKLPSQDVCFGSSLTKYVRQVNEAFYTIVLINNTSYVDRSNNNYCWMNKHQLENYLRRISTIKPFKYKVIERRYSGSPCYKINVVIKGTRKEATFILQSIKRAYEFPYNFFLLQAYKMQELPEFKFESVLNLFNVAYSTFYPAGRNSGHSYSGSSKFEKYATIREKLPHVLNTTDIYPEFIEGKKASRIKDIYYYKEVPGDTNQWNEALFTQLLPAYMKNYEILKR